MSLHGIDISNWKADFDPMAVDFDFLVVQVTWGTGEVSRNGLVNGVWTGADAKIQQCLVKNKRFGYMHYIRGTGAESEATFFAANTVGYLHHGLPCIDWESADNKAWGNPSYLDAFLTSYIQQTGIKPLVYVQKSAVHTIESVAKTHDCGLWIAQYSDNSSTSYQDHPWNESTYSCTMRQYTSHGRLPGYSGDLDLNKFYGDEQAWDSYVNASNDMHALATTTYTIIQGDTLSGIAQRFHTTISTLATMNNIIDPNRIYAGDKLQIPRQ